LKLDDDLFDVDARFEVDARFDDEVPSPPVVEAEGLLPDPVEGRVPAEGLSLVPADGRDEPSPPPRP